MQVPRPRHSTPARYYDPGGSPPYFPTPGVNSIQFKVHDTDADATVNLTLNDPNATRDGLSNPVFSASVAIDSITHGSTPAQNGLVYTFPSAIVYGGGWNVTVSAPLGGFAFENLTLYTYGVSDQSNPAQGSAVLPGESVTLNWWVVSAANGGAYNDLTNLTLWGSYYNGTAYHDAFSTALVALPLTAAGSTTFTIPTDAAALTTFYFNLSGVVKVGSTVTANWTYYSALFVGNTWISGGSMSSPCGTVNDGAFFVGCPVQVIGYAGAEAGAQFNPVPGLTVTIAFWNGTTHVTPGGNPPTTLSTAANGEVSFSFTADVPPFTLDTVHPFVNAVNITVNDTKATGVGAWTTWHNGSFRVAPGAATGAVEVALNANEYAPGATVTATWTLSSSNTSVGALDATEWELATENGGLLATGSITSTASTGTFTVPLPADLLGQFYVWVIATNATSSFSGGAYAIVEQPTLAVSGSLYFTPGSQLSWNLVFSPAALAGTTTTYTVIGYWDDQYGDEISNGLVATGTVGSSNVVSYSVPGTGAATYYDLEVSAQTTATGVYATAGTDSELETGYSVEIGVSTASNYADGSCQPGQTIQVSWAVYWYSGLPLPPTYQVYIALGPLAFFFGPNVAVAETLATTATSGTIGLSDPLEHPLGLTGDRGRGLRARSVQRAGLRRGKQLHRLLLGPDGDHRQRPPVASEPGARGRERVHGRDVDPPDRDHRGRAGAVPPDAARPEPEVDSVDLFGHRADVARGARSVDRTGNGMEGDSLNPSHGRSRARRTTSAPDSPVGRAVASREERTAPLRWSGARVTTVQWANSDPSRRTDRVAAPASSPPKSKIPRISSTPIAAYSESR